MKTQFTRRFLTAAIAAMLLASSYTVAQKVSEAEVQYRDALRKQQVEGDLDAAMKLYQNIIVSKTADRPTRAKALLQLAACYESLGRKADALYQQVVQDFGDQPAAKQAAEKLAALRAGQGLVASRMLLRGSVDSGASVMPDGRLIMTDWSTGDVVIRDMTTGQIKRLMAKPESQQESRNSAESPVLSPDLRQLAYNWWDNSRRSLQLRVMPNESGGKPRVLIPNAEWEFNYFEPSAWSSDGKSILVNLWNRDGTKQIAWVSVADGTIRVLKSLEWRLREGRSRLSPDGRYVVYSAWEGSGLRNSAIHIVAADGSSENLLVKPGGFNGTPVWTPDGKHVVYLSDRKGSLGLWSVPVQDGKATDEPALVKADVGSIVPIGFTRGGSYYYVRSDDALDIFLADVDPASGNIRGHVAVTQKFVGSNLTPVWSPDGKFIVFNSRRQQGEEYPSDVVVYSFETGEERTYAMHLMRLAGNPMWFRDGKAVLQGMRDQQGRVFFYRVDLKTGEFKQVVATGGTSGSVESAISPDDKTVYTNVGVGNRGSPVIRAFDLATGLERRQVFTVKDGRIPGLGLSPDGRTLAFKIVYPEKSETHVCIVGIDGNGFRDLHTDTTDQDRVRPQLAWSKDGRAILFTRYSSNQDWQLMRIPGEGGKPEFTGLAGKGTAGIDLSPDGARIVFNDGTPGTPELWTLDNLPILKTAR